MAVVQILLATWNGAAFVREQLESVLGQTFTDIEVLVADDGSTDETMSIVDAIAREHPGKIRVLFRERVGGAARNFMRLIEAAESPYLMCCDQDDVWLPEKISILLARCRALEVAHPGKPVLVHSDVTVVDASLQLIAPSFFAYQKIDPGRTRLRDLLIHSCVTGCAMLMNRPLQQRVRGSDPDAMIMHDWWISLVAAGFGVIEVTREPTVLYRQHGANTLGATQPSLIYFARRALTLARGGRLNRHLRKCFRQADAFMRRYGDDLGKEDRSACRLVAGLAAQTPLKLRYLLLRHQLVKQGLFRTLAMLLVV